MRFLTVFITALFFGLQLNAATFIETTEAAKQYLKESYPDIYGKEKKYVASDEEKAELNKTFDLTVQRRFDEALQVYQKLEVKYPQSTKVVMDHAMFLINRGKHKQALRLVTQKQKEFPKHLGLKVIYENLKKTQKFRSKKTRRKSLQEMDVFLAAWRQSLVGK